MAKPIFKMKDLIEAGVHFGHKTKRWNPQMAPFIYGVRSGTHIIDLGQTAPMLHAALNAIREVAAAGGKILFVGTKRQAADIVAEAAKSCDQYYINQRWLGGLMTNWNTIQKSIKRLKALEEQLADPEITSAFTKKELLNLERSRDKLERSLGGIKEIGGLPDLLFIIDTNREELAVKEAAKLGIPTVAIVDTNASLEGITFPIPGNDDATRAIALYCRLVAKTISDAREEAGLTAIAEEAATAEEAEFAEGAESAELEEKETQDDKGKAAKKKTATSTTKKEAMAEAAKEAAKKDKEEEDGASASEEELKEQKEEEKEKKTAKKKKTTTKSTTAKKPSSTKKKKPAKDKEEAKEEKAESESDSGAEKEEETKAGDDKKEDSSCKGSDTDAAEEAEKKAS